MDRPCGVCAKPGCVPLEHIDEVLSDENAQRWAQVILDDSTMGNVRGRMLARYILSKKPV